MTRRQAEDRLAAENNAFYLGVLMGMTAAGFVVAVLLITGYLVTT